MRIAHVTSEIHPFSKTGGLADVCEALPAALASFGMEVTVLSPWHRSVADYAQRRALRIDERRVEGVEVRIGEHSWPLVFRRVDHEGARVVFIVNDELYDRATIYVDAAGRDYADNLARFTFLCRAALEYFIHVERAAPDVFHAHDWQAALVPVYLKTLYRPSPVGAAHSLFTIHNLGYQGNFAAARLPDTGLGWHLFHVDALEYYGGINLMKAGIVFADAVTTVSPSYAAEIQTPELGRGLDGVARAQAYKLAGILNGIDVGQWNPADDPHLPAHYDATDTTGKARCKEELQRRFGLPARPESFLLGVVSRLDAQKGIPLILDALPRLAPLDVQLVMLGDGDPALAAGARALAAAHPERVSARIGYDEALAHLIEAGADAFLMPSAYEPSGLNQMYSQRYGTIPIVRATGGLRDTVSDFTPAAQAAGHASGFAFEAFDAAHLADAIRRAAVVFFLARQSWRDLMRHCMKLDWSWQRTARDYERLYRRVGGTGDV